MPTAVLDDTITHFGGFFSSFMVSWLLNFTESRCVHLQHLRHYKLLKLLNPSCQTSLFVNCAGGSQGVQLLDGSNKGQVQAIRLRQVWGSWYPACVLANLLTHVSQLCQKLNMPPPKELYRPTFFKHWRHFLDQNYNRQAVCLGYGGCSFVCRYLRLTRLLSTPLVNLRIGDWLCILPAIILVVDKSKKVNKGCLLRLTGGELLIPQDRRLYRPSPLEEQGATVYRVQYIVFDTGLLHE